jgi:ACR3 family arsenite transporter
MAGPMGLFERWLSLWVALAIALGVMAGLLVPGFFAGVAALEVAHVNLPVAVLIWAMIFPMMVQVDFAAVRQVGRQPRALALTLVVNWLIKPFTMALLALLCFRWLYAPWVAPELANEIIAGMILLGVAPCTAMVFVWSQLVRGDPNYTLVQVSINDVVMVFAFAPLAALLLGVTQLTVPWSTLLLSVGLYVVLPLLAGIAVRRALLARSPRALDDFLARIKPMGAGGLLATVALLFGLQAGTMVSQPLLMVLIALPLVAQSYGVFALAWMGARRLRLPFDQAAPACLIGTSNFFELAVAVAISLFGLTSGAALATVVGVLVEVPVMLSLVAWANRRRSSFAGPGPAPGTG